MLLVCQRQQLQTDFTTVHPRDAYREVIFLLSAFEQQIHVLPFQYPRFTVNFYPQAAVRVVMNGTGEQVAIRAGNRRRH